MISLLLSVYLQVYRGVSNRKLSNPTRFALSKMSGVERLYILSNSTRFALSKKKNREYSTHCTEIFYRLLGMPRATIFGLDTGKTARLSTTWLSIFIPDRISVDPHPKSGAYTTQGRVRHLSWTFPPKQKVQSSQLSSNPRRDESTRILSYIVDYCPIIFSISASSREET